MADVNNVALVLCGCETWSVALGEDHMLLEESTDIEGGGECEKA